METRNLDPAQFEALDGKLGGIDGAINRLAENVSEPDTSVAAEISSLKEMVSVGFADIRQGISDLNNTIFDAIKLHSDNTGKWLAAIALATATPDDNSAEIKALAEQLNSSTAALDAVVKQNQP